MRRQFAHRAGCALLGELGIELRANENGKPRDVEPEHEPDYRAHRSVGDVVIRNMAEVIVEDRRAEEPDGDGEEGSGKSGKKAMAAVRTEVVDELEACNKGHEDEDQTDGGPEVLDDRR